MDQGQTPPEPHLTPEAQARRLRLGEQFDHAASNIEESLEHAQAMLDDLMRDSRYQPAPESR